jgi:hypothetical protein
VVRYVIDYISEATDSIPDLVLGSRVAEGNSVLKPHLEIAERNVGAIGAIILDNGCIRLDVVPQSGAKIISRVRIETLRQKALRTVCEVSARSIICSRAVREVLAGMCLCVAPYQGIYSRGCRKKGRGVVVLES